jgi:hypothetical protein
LSDDVRSKIREQNFLSIEKVGDYMVPLSLSSFLDETKSPFDDSFVSENLLQGTLDNFFKKSDQSFLVDFAFFTTSFFLQIAETADLFKKNFGEKNYGLLTKFIFQKQTENIRQF